MPQTLDKTFQNYDEQVRKLVEEHLEIKEDPLLLALRYQPPHDPKHIFLFEIIENFGGGRIDPDQEFFEVTFGSSSGFPMQAEERLHLVLTNPNEFEVAMRNRWPLAEEIRQAVQSGRGEVLYRLEGAGEELLGAVS